MVHAFQCSAVDTFCSFPLCTSLCVSEWVCVSLFNCSLGAYECSLEKLSLKSACSVFILFKHCTDLYVSLAIFLCIALTAEKQHCIEQCVCVHETVKHVNKIQKKLLEYSQRWTNLWETILHACHLIHNDQHIICTQTLIQEKKLLIERNG